MNIEIKLLERAYETSACAELMAGSEPWLTLRRTFDDCLKLLNEPGKEVYVARDGESVVGFVVLQLRGPFTGYIQSIGVMPEWRSRGIGTRLLRRLIAIARKRDVQGFMGLILGNNVRMMSLFHRAGVPVESTLERGVFTVRIRSARLDATSPGTSA